jgi:GT2 family glycosyltransferase
MTEAEQPRFSVIVVSRQRPTWLHRCVTALKQLDYPAFEIVIVADEASLAGFDDPSCKVCAFDAANISAARNVGIAHSAGEICAFIDDDAVAEPLWLHHLARSFDVTNADAVVGFVRGRNGISFQSRAASVDAEAETHAEPYTGDAPSVLNVQDGRATKLIGTNMAIRRDVLLEMEGFDEAYRFFLEDADLSLRLQRAGKRIGIAPLAEVHHGVAPSVRRSGRRAPLDLFDIGRSTRYFIAKHGCTATEEIWERIERRERARLVTHMVAGTCEPKDVNHRMKSLKRGWDDLAHVVRAKDPFPDMRETIFFAVSPKRTGSVVLSSFLWVKRRNVTRMARSRVSGGERVSVFSFSLTSARHHVRYVEPGFWLQTGGLYGKSDRSEPWFKWCRFADRLRREIRRVAKQRGIGDIDGR